MKKVIVTILAVGLLLVGCTPSGATVDELQSKITELEERLAEAEAQTAEMEASQDKSKAIVEFAREALELQSAFIDACSDWLDWYAQNLPDDYDDYPRYTIRSKEIEAIDEAGKLMYEVRSTITAIEQLYAPSEALETKKGLLAEGDLLMQAFVDIMNYYAGPDTRPIDLYQEALDFISDELYEINRDVRRELIDLRLEYE